MNRRQHCEYHPTPFYDKGSSQAYRKVRNRLFAMIKHYDFQGKSVLDLGCSGGYFSFQLAKYARYVLAIDADANQVRLNKQMSREMGISNIDFQVGIISPALIRSLNKFDVTLFLSVLHHIIATSNVYPWNLSHPDPLRYSIEILAALHERSSTLFFEMGQSNESHEWATKLPDMQPAPDVWIVQELLRPAGFSNVSIIEPPDQQGVVGRLRKLIYHTMEGSFAGKSLIGRALGRVVSYDTRDSRYMFMASVA